MSKPPPVKVSREPKEKVKPGPDGLVDPQENAEAHGVSGAQSLAIVGMDEVIKWASSLPGEDGVREQISNRGPRVKGGDRRSLEVLLCYLVQRERHRELKEREPDWLGPRIEEYVNECQKEVKSMPDAKKEKKAAKAEAKKRAAPPTTKATAAPAKKPVRKAKVSSEGVDKQSGLRLGTKKFKVYESYKSGGTMEQATKAALSFQGKTDEASRKSTEASVRSWFRDFERKHGVKNKSSGGGAKAAKKKAGNKK